MKKRKKPEEPVFYEDSLPDEPLAQGLNQAGDGNIP